MEIVFPEWLKPSTAMFGLDDFTAVDSSATTGASSTSELFGTRKWHCRMDFPVLRRDDGTLQLFQGLVASLRGRSSRVWIRDRSYVKRGSFPTGELVPDSSFANAANWTVPSGSFLVVQDRMARVQNTAAAGARISSAAIPLVNGGTYIVRAGLYPGKASTWVVALGTTATAFDLVTSGALSSPGLYFNGAVCNAASGFLSLYCDTAVVGDFVHYTFASVSRGAWVNGANQTGTALNVKGLPASTNGTLLVGDMVQILLPTYGAQLVRLVAPVNSDSTGAGYMQFEPALKESPANTAPVAINQPMGRFQLLNGSVGVELSPGIFGNCSLEFVEA